MNYWAFKEFPKCDNCVKSDSLMRGRVDPNYLPQCLKQAQDRAASIAGRYARKLESVESIIAEEGRLTKRIEELNKNIQTESIFECNSRKAITALEKDREELEKENFELRKKIVDLTYKQCSINKMQGNRIIDGVIKGIDEKTPLVRYSILRSLLLEQKARLYKLEEERRVLTSKCFCIEDTSDVNDYIIGENYDTEDRTGSYSKIFAEKMEEAKKELPEVYTHPCEVSSDEIAGLSVGIQNEECNSGIQFDVISQMKTKEQNCSLSAIDRYIQTKESHQGTKEEVCDLIEEERNWEPKVINDASKVPQWKAEISKSLGHSQKTINSLSNALSFDVKIRDKMQNVVDTLCESAHYLSSDVTESCIDKIEQPGKIHNESIGVTPEAQVRRVNELAFNVSKSLDDYDLKQKSAIESISNVIESMNEDKENLIQSTQVADFDDEELDKEIEQIIALQNEMEENQRTQVSILTEYTESLPKFYDEQIDDMDGIKEIENTNSKELDDLYKEFQSIKMPKYVHAENKEDELFRTVRSNKYSLNLSFEMDDEEENQVENITNRPAAMFNEWKKNCGEINNFGDPEAIAEEIKQLREEYERVQKLISEMAFNSKMKSEENARRKKELTKMIDDTKAAIERLNKKKN